MSMEDAAASGYKYVGPHNPAFMEQLARSRAAVRAAEAKAVPDVSGLEYPCSLEARYRAALERIARGKGVADPHYLVEIAQEALK